MERLCFCIPNPWARRLISAITLGVSAMWLMVIIHRHSDASSALTHPQHGPSVPFDKKSWRTAADEMNPDVGREIGYIGRSLKEHSNDSAELPAFEQYNAEFVTRTDFYDPRAPYLERLLHDLATAEIKAVHFHRAGYQFKFHVDFVNGNRAMAKPKRSGRDYYFPYDEHSWLCQFERHTAEIASFHLDRILDFGRVPICIGRKLNFTSDIIMKTTDYRILGTRVVKDGNECIIGKCDYCVKNKPVCAENGMLEVSMCQMLPHGVLHRLENGLWEQVYKITEEDVKHRCQKLDKKPIIQEIPELFYDLVEECVFSHLIVKYDSYGVFLVNSLDKQHTGVGWLDHGRAFGNPFLDEKSFLNPLKICCRFRNSTYLSLIELSNEGNLLGDRMRASLAKDPLAPILTEDFFPALDRRLAQTLDSIRGCIKEHGESNVLL